MRENTTNKEAPTTRTASETGGGRNTRKRAAKTSVKQVLREAPQWLREQLAADREALAERLMREEGMEEADARETAAKELQVAARLPQFERIYKEHAQAVRAPKREKIEDFIEQGAVLRQPVVRGLLDYLTQRHGTRRGPAKAAMASASLIEQSFGFGQPLINQSHNRLTRDHGALWAYDHADGLTEKGLYTALQKQIDDPHVDPAICMAVNVELLRQISELKDEQGELRFPSVGKSLMVDGTAIQSDHEQKWPENGQLNLGPEHARVGVGFYGGKKRERQENGETIREAGASKFWIGYKLVIIADMSTQVPMVWKLIPAEGDERKAALELLESLYRLWPDCPAEYIVGDSFYFHSIDFSKRVVFNYGLRPAFHTRANVSNHLPYMPEHPEWPGEWGVPRCKGCSKLMRLHEIGGCVTLESRRKARLKPGEMAPTAGARLRFRCNDCGGTSSSKISEDPRIYTALPIAGDSEARVRREVLLIRRNGIESLNATIKWRGKGNRDQRRGRKATDRRMDWHFGLHLMYLTGRRLIHLNGGYERALAEATACGVHAPGKPANFDEVAHRRQLRDRDQHWGRPVAPRSTNLIELSTIPEQRLALDDAA